MSDSILPEPLRFEFFQAVRLLQNFLKYEQSDQSVDVVCQKLNDELIKFRSASTKRFPASQIFDAQDVREDEQTITELEVSFFGLFGPISSLPWHDTERAIRQKPFRLFLEVFNHRLITLFYRAWEKNHFYVGFEKGRAEQQHSDNTEEGNLNARAGFADPISDGHGDLTNLLFGLIGLGSTSRKLDREIDTDGLISHASVFVGQQRNRFGMLEVLKAYFPKQPISILEFSKNQLQLDESQCTSLASGNSLDAQLGIGTILGSVITEFQSKFRIKIGPISYTEFLEYLPDRKCFRELNQLVRLCSGEELEFDFQFEIESGILPAELKSPYQQYQLGQNTWLLSDSEEFRSSAPVFTSLDP